MSEVWVTQGWERPMKSSSSPGHLQSSGACLAPGLTGQPGTSPGRGLSAPQPCPPPWLQDGDGPYYKPLRPPSLLSSQPRQGEERKGLF